MISGEPPPPPQSHESVETSGEKLDCLPGGKLPAGYPPPPPPPPDSAKSVGHGNGNANGNAHSQWDGQQQYFKGGLYKMYLIFVLFNDSWRFTPCRLSESSYSSWPSYETSSGGYSASFAVRFLKMKLIMMRIGIEDSFEFYISFDSTYCVGFYSFNVFQNQNSVHVYGQQPDTYSNSYSGPVSSLKNIDHVFSVLSLSSYAWPFCY